MFSFFPKPYPDELLYSIFARYHIRSGNISAKDTIKELFNSTTYTACIDMPAHLDTLISNLPVGTSCTSDNLLIKHTLFPYYTAFLDEDRVTRIKRLMKSDFGGEIHTITGIMASTINTPKILYLCPECSKSDRELFGEAYWHRIHQVPGVLYCPYHGFPLHSNSINIYESNKHIFIAAEEANDQLYCVNNADVDTEKLIEISREIMWVFDNYDTLRDSVGNGIRDKYISLLKEKNIATSKGRVYQLDLINDFKDYYSDNLLNKLQSNIEYDDQCNWLSSIVRKHRKSFHPLRHVLFIKFLEGSLEKFFKTDYKYNPFGTGMWPCLNAGSDHYKQSVIKNISITHCCDTKRPVGTFKCDCGFVYSRRGPDQTAEDRYRIGRIKQFGAVWEDKLKEYVNAGLGLRETARNLNVDAKTIKKYRSKLGLHMELNNIDDSFTKTPSRNDEGNVDYKHRWNGLMKENPEKSKTELRTIEPALYTWLYRNEREWLINNSPKPRQIINSTSKVDWNVRDIDILEKVKHTVILLQCSENKPVRITVGRIGKILGLSSLLEKHLDRLSKVKEYINSQVESIEDFQVRRVIWAIDELMKNGKELKVWIIKRKAGLKKDNRIDIYKLMDEVLRKNNFA